MRDQNCDTSKTIKLFQDFIDVDNRDSTERAAASAAAAKYTKPPTHTQHLLSTELNMVNQHVSNFMNREQITTPGVKSVLADFVSTLVSTQILSLPPPPCSSESVSTRATTSESSSQSIKVILYIYIYTTTTTTSHYIT